MAKSTAVAKKPRDDQELVAIDAAFDDIATTGLEGVGASDVLIPRITILQALSPQLNKKRAEYIVGAEVGHICDVGTGEFWPEITFLPVLYRKDYIEWPPQRSNKGPVAIYSDASILDDCERDDKGKPILPNGNYIAETAQFYGLNLSSLDLRKSYLPMTSTQLKKAKKWITLATSEKIHRRDGSVVMAPLFYRGYHLSVVSEQNDEGDWFGWRVDRDARNFAALAEAYNVSWQELKAECMAFQESLRKGEARGDLVQQAEEAEEVL